MIWVKTAHKDLHVNTRDMKITRDSYKINFNLNHK